MQVTFQSDFSYKGKTKEPRCKRISLETQELDDETIAELAKLDDVLVTVTITY